jgi:hypothetical protein
MFALARRFGDPGQVGAVRIDDAIVALSGE